MKLKLQRKSSQIKNIFLTFLTLLISSNFLVAQDYEVTPLSDFVNIYKQKYSAISERIENHKDISVADKLVLYQSKLDNLKDDFINSRRSEYLAKTIKRAKKNSCKGTRIRGVTNCSSVVINAPNKYMYTQKDWVKVEGESKYMEVTIDSSEVRLGLSANGTRTNKGVIYATFKYKPKMIASLISKEVNELFGKVIETKE